MNISVRQKKMHFVLFTSATAVMLLFLCNFSMSCILNTGAKILVHVSHNHRMRLCSAHLCTNITITKVIEKILAFIITTPSWLLYGNVHE